MHDHLRVLWFANQIRDMPPGIELSGSKFRWKRQNCRAVGSFPAPGTARRDRAIIRRSAMTAPRYLVFLISRNAFKRIRTGFARCVSDVTRRERLVCCLANRSYVSTFPLWGAIYFRHGVTAVDCICNAGCATTTTTTTTTTHTAPYAWTAQLFNII